MDRMTELLRKWSTTMQGKQWELDDIARLIVEAQIAAEPLTQLAERERVVRWVEEHRSALELEPEVFIYRDHFNSRSLIAFLRGDDAQTDTTQ